MVGTRPAARALFAAAAMDPPVRTIRAGLDDGELWHGESHSTADAGAGSDPAAGALRSLLADGRALVFDRGIAALRDLCRLRGARGRDPAVHPADRGARGAAPARSNAARPADRGGRAGPVWCLSGRHEPEQRAGGLDAVRRRSAEVAA